MHHISGSVRNNYKYPLIIQGQGQALGVTKRVYWRLLHGQQIHSERRYPQMHNGVVQNKLNLAFVTLLSVYISPKYLTPNMHAQQLLSRPA